MASLSPPLENVSVTVVRVPAYRQALYLVCCVKSPFTLIVIPGSTKPAPCLTRGNPDAVPAKAGNHFYTLNPDFHREPWIPAGVYPVLDTGRE
jgi:hypothetical protein